MPKEWQNCKNHTMELRHVVLNFKSPPKERKSGAAYQAEYRERLKCNPRNWEQFRNLQKQYMENYLRSLTEEEKLAKKEKANERRRERRRAMKESREANKNALQTSTKPEKKKTRKAVKDSRAYWRERKRIQRESMSEEEKRAAKDRANELRRQNRAARKAEVTSLDTASSLPVPIEPAVDSFYLPSPVAFSIPVVQPVYIYKSKLKPPSPSYSHQLQNTQQLPSFSSPSPTKNAKYGSLKRPRKTYPKSPLRSSTFGPNY